MARPDDRRCQWCHAVVAVSTDKGMLDVADFAEFDDKLYCTGRSGNCWDNLLAMSKFVSENFDDGRAS